MTVKVNGKEFKTLKEAQDYSKELKADPNYVAPVQQTLESAIPSDESVLIASPDAVEAIAELSADDKIDLAAQIDSLTDEDPELAEELDAALTEE